MSTTLVQHAEGLAVVIDPSLLERLNITADTPLELSTNGDAIVVTPVRDKDQRGRIQASLEKINQKFGPDLERLAQ